MGFAAWVAVIYLWAPCEDAHVLGRGLTSPTEPTCCAAGGLGSKRPSCLHPSIGLFPLPEQQDAFWGAQVMTAEACLHAEHLL